MTAKAISVELIEEIRKDAAEIRAQEIEKLTKLCAEKASEFEYLMYHEIYDGNLETEYRILITKWFDNLPWIAK